MRYKANETEVDMSERKKEASVLLVCEREGINGTLNSPVLLVVAFLSPVVTLGGSLGSVSWSVIEPIIRRPAKTKRADCVERGPRLENTNK